MGPGHQEDQRAGHARRRVCLRWGGLPRRGLVTCGRLPVGPASCCLLSEWDLTAVGFGGLGSGPRPEQPRSSGVGASGPSCTGHILLPQGCRRAPFLICRAALEQLEGSLSPLMCVCAGADACALG